MIKLFFNTSVQAYEVFVNGVKVEGVANVRIDAANDFNGPKATIVAMVEIVNEKPGNEERDFERVRSGDLINRSKPT